MTLQAIDEMGYRWQPRDCPTRDVNDVCQHRDLRNDLNPHYCKASTGDIPLGCPYRRLAGRVLVTVEEDQ